MRTNTRTPKPKIYTHEGARAVNVNAELQLRRFVLACMLWEDAFYGDGQSIADRITNLIPQVQPAKVHALMREARDKMKLRHIPLLLAVECCKSAKHRENLQYVIEDIIQRPDELTEILAIYAKQNDRKDAKKLNSLARQLKLGIARAFNKFNEYSFAKYNRDGEVKLRDALFLTHPYPKDRAQQKLFNKIVEGTLETPDTWEVTLSAGGPNADKKSLWEGLLREEKLGALALLRNLRNMRDAGVNESLVRTALKNIKTERVLPFRFISAARYAPQWEPELEQAMFKCVEGMPKLPGKTAIVVDNSGSMDGPKISAKSELDRSDAACALAILAREVCERTVVIGFGNEAKVIPARRGFALRDAIKNGPGGGTYTDTALALAQSEGYDRIIVITDEQSHQTIRNPSYNGQPKTGYFINVATYKNGIGYGPWTHIDGWSEAIIDYIQASESLVSEKAATN